MTTADPTLAILRLVDAVARGPKRDGAFALWLTARVALDLTLPDRPTERAHRRRLQALDKRLSSLTLPPPLRRATHGALHQLRDGSGQTAAQVLAQLVAPARDTLGPEAASALQDAARTAQRRVAATLRGN